MSAAPSQPPRPNDPLHCPPVAPGVKAESSITLTVHVHPSKQVLHQAKHFAHSVAQAAHTGSVPTLNDAALVALDSEQPDLILVMARDAPHRVTSTLSRQEAAQRTPVAKAPDGEEPSGIYGIAVGSMVGDAWAISVALRPPGDDRLFAWLIRSSLDAASYSKMSRARTWLSNPDHEDRRERELFELGFVGERDLFQMHRDLPVKQGLGPRITTRAFRPGCDDEKWLLANNRAFAGHPEQGAWRLDDLVRREAEAWFDPSGFLLHEQGEQIAAFCWTKIHHGEVGEIYVIGVDPDFQGMGLGTAITLAGLDHLAKVGAKTAMLYVDRESAGAIAMYRKLGFEVSGLHRCYLREL